MPTSIINFHDKKIRSLAFNAAGVFVGYAFVPAGSSRGWGIMDAQGNLIGHEETFAGVKRELRKVGAVRFSEPAFLVGTVVMENLRFAEEVPVCSRPSSPVVSAAVMDQSAIPTSLFE
jgi:hypothetical protein